MVGHCEGCSCDIAHTRAICWKSKCNYCQDPPRKHGFNHDAWVAKMKKESERAKLFKG